MESQGRRLLTSSELAAELGWSTRTVSRYAETGKLRPWSTTPGGHHRWDLDDVREQLQEMRRHGP